MTIETLAKQGRDRVHSGLAGIDYAKLRKMRNESMRQCFSHLDETRYRMEFVATIHGKRFVNDAAARSINATWYALENLDPGSIWITHGNNKNDFSRLKEAAARKVRMLICVGSNNENLHKTFDGIIPEILDVDSLRTACTRALYNNIETATVLYSPACEDELMTEVHGEEFRYEVNEL